MVGVGVVKADKVTVDQEVILTDGSQIQGMLVGEGDAEGLAWLPRFGDEESLVLRVESIERIFNPGRHRVRDGAANLVLTNKDILSGTLESIDEDAAIISDPSYGKLTIPKEYIRDMHVDRNGYLFLNRVGANDDWVNIEGNPVDWFIKRNTLYSHGRGTIAREMLASNSLHVSFDYQFDAESPNLSVFLFAGDTANFYRGAHYRLDINRGTYMGLPFGNRYAVTLRRSTIERGEQRDVDQLLLQGRFEQPVIFTMDRRPRNMRVEIKADLDARIVQLIINGTEIHQWTEVGGLVEPGRFIGFQNSSVDDSCSISNLKITRWYKNEHVEGPASDQVNEGRDIVNMRNGDYFSGEIIDIAEDVLKLRTSTFGDLLLPRANILNMELVDDRLSSKVPRFMKEDIRVHLNQGSSLVFQFGRISDGVLYGRSEVFGEIGIALDNIHEIEFNLYGQSEAGRDLPINFRGFNYNRLLEGVWSINL